MRTVRVAWTPISEDEWPLDAVEIKGTPAQYSVALGRRPVNQFLIDAALNFRNHNGRGFQPPRPRNRVSKITILPRRLTVLHDIHRGEGARETKPVKNSLDANARKVNLRAALRFRGEIENGVDMAGSQLFAAASQFGKNPPHQASRQSHGWRRKGCRLACRSLARGKQQGQWRQ